MWIRRATQNAQTDDQENWRVSLVFVILLVRIGVCYHFAAAILFTSDFSYFSGFASLSKRDTRVKIGLICIACCEINKGCNCVVS